MVRDGTLPRGGTLRQWIRAYVGSLRDAAAGRDDADPAIREARRRLLEAQAESAEMDLGQRRRELVAVEEVQAHWLRIGGSFRARLLLIPRSVAPLAAQRPAAEVEDVVREKIYEALDELADGEVK
jgi:phage terminase Nu1 subunit (DNA packaging protein)